MWASANKKQNRFKKEAVVVARRQRKTGTYNFLLEEYTSPHHCQSVFAL
jgi:hypothetical protein